MKWIGIYPQKGSALIIFPECEEDVHLHYEHFIWGNTKLLHPQIYISLVMRQLAETILMKYHEHESMTFH